MENIIKIKKETIFLENLIIDRTILMCLDDYLDDIFTMRKALSDLVTGFDHLTVENRIKNLRIRTKEDKEVLHNTWLKSNPLSDFKEWINDIYYEAVSIINK